VSRTSGFYPDIFMGYPGPLRQLGVVAPQALLQESRSGAAGPQG